MPAVTSPPSFLPPVAALSIQLVLPDGPLVADTLCQVVCQVVGARPPPAITWWAAGDRILQRASEAVSCGELRPREAGLFICRGINPLSDYHLRAHVPFCQICY